MTPFKPIKQIRVSEEVVVQLKGTIMLGHFKPGDRLPSERELAEQFQVSRVAVREALRALENSGFIITRQGATGGAFVTDLTYKHLSKAFLDLFLAEKLSIPEMNQIRLMVEPEIEKPSRRKNYPPTPPRRIWTERQRSITSWPKYPATVSLTPLFGD
jgi:GntR family transcriptional repressor for pyruvate dehydrogenase complex